MSSKLYIQCIVMAMTIIASAHAELVIRNFNFNRAEEKAVPPKLVVKPSEGPIPLLILTKSTSKTPPGPVEGYKTAPNLEKPLPPIEERKTYPFRQTVIYQNSPYYLYKTMGTALQEALDQRFASENSMKENSWIVSWRVESSKAAEFNEEIEYAINCWSCKMSVTYVGVTYLSPDSDEYEAGTTASR